MTKDQMKRSQDRPLRLRERLIVVARGVIMLVQIARTIAWLVKMIN